MNRRATIWHILELAAYTLLFWLLFACVVLIIVAAQMQRQSGSPQ